MIRALVSVTAAVTRSRSRMHAVRSVGVPCGRNRSHIRLTKEFCLFAIRSEDRSCLSASYTSVVTTIRVGAVGKNELFQPI